MKGKDLVENMGARPYKCYHCGYILGVTTDNILYVGSILLRKHITLECGHCNKTTFWKPSSENMAKK